MYKRLHKKLTFFCTLITGLILATMSGICLVISEKGMKDSNYNLFLSSIQTIFSSVETQLTVSHQWLSQMEQDGICYIYLFDNGEPLLFQSIHRSEYRDQLLEAALTKARDEYGLDVQNPAGASKLTQHTEFELDSPEGPGYYVSAVRFSKSRGKLSALICYSQESQNRQIQSQRQLFVAVDLIALLFLGLFAWFFTKRQIQPLEENRKRQVQFIAAASHELRSPLAVILSSLSALKKSSGENRERYEAAIESEGRRMSRLIDDMLQLANADNQTWSMQMGRWEPETLLLTVYENFEQTAKQKSIAFGIHFPEDPLPAVFCDRERMIQILSALTDNAISYTPPGGKIRLAAACAGSFVEFQICDNGPGIPDDAKEHIFDRFYRVDSAHKDKEHFGLGLCIVQEIVRLHRGKIWVEDTEGGGATFRIRIPI
ncbi:HAMP domain-containing histidine kinase [Cuneatibacter sp. NSJ-177]|uniref:sensor histidine kinase n=1 Tax=Cuneatibacter sp. NSJ-177 TaxID=2931401 RepID=UPI001FD61CDA|nr:HAMP domain-containing sensor histidine kinase [Cuneatibacter sp. NSJ-177]MCJ7835566.1 HAMP domain-containing histidine kinase [Cuneatibacter sp. NSJ-177]